MSDPQQPESKRPDGSGTVPLNSAQQALLQRQRMAEQQGLEIIRSGGGWNARTRLRLAAFASSRGIDLRLFLAALSRAATGSSTATASQPTRTETPSASSTTRPLAADARPAPPSTRRVERELIIGVSLLLLALVASIFLVRCAVRRAAATAEVSAAQSTRSSDTPAAPQPEALDSSRMQPRSESLVNQTASDSISLPPDRATRDAARNTPPVPAIYSRPPSLRADSSPQWTRTALESLASDESELLSIQARIGAGALASEADRAAWTRATRALTASWPLLAARRRDTIIDSCVALHKKLGDSNVRAALRAPLESLRGSEGTDPESLWRGSGAAGILAALELQAAGGAPLAFGEAALQWLAPRSTAVCDSVLSGNPTAAADRVDAWLQATEAATSSGPLRDEREPRILSLLDLLLRRGAPLERPGVSADAAGTLLDALGWTGTPARRSKIEGAFRAWFEDPAITAVSLHGLTSVLAARRPGAWWEPWMVSSARATMADRFLTADRFTAALALTQSEVGGNADAPRIRGVRPELVDRWVRVSQAALARTPAADPAFRLAHAAALLAMVESARLLERGRTSDAEARISQVEDPTALAPDDTDRWKDRTERTVGRAPAVDGKLEMELRARIGADDKSAAIRSLRARAIGDLGPADAAVLAHEALASPSAPMRSVAQGVIADILSSGPNMIAALAAEVPSAVDAKEAASLAGMVASQPVPRGTDEYRRAAAMLLLLDRHAELVPSDRHRIDSVAKEFTYSGTAVARALAGRNEGVAVSPEVALRAWFDARAAEIRPLVPATHMETIFRSIQARRRLAAPGPQLAVAELVGILELDAAVVAERLPRRRSQMEAILNRAAADRASSLDVFAQIECTTRALLEIALLSIAPEGGAE